MDKKREASNVTREAISLGLVEKIPLGQGFCFVVGKEEIAVFRPRSGGLFAIQNRCPHRNAPLADGVADECHVICPFHGHKFNLQTGSGSEADETVQVYEVGEESGKIVLKM